MFRFLAIGEQGQELGACEARDRDAAFRILAPRFGSRLSKVQSQVARNIEQDEMDTLERRRRERAE